MATSDNWFSLAFPDNTFDGSITDADGRIIYTLTSEKRSFRSDVTTIVRPDASVAAMIKWGSIVELKRRLVLVQNATIPAKEYLALGDANTVGGPGSQVFQDLDGNEYYWKDEKCQEVKTKAVVAYYQPPDVDRALGPRLWVHQVYFSSTLLEPLVITALLMAKAKGRVAHSSAPVSSNARRVVTSAASSSRTRYGASSPQKHGAAGGYVGAYGVGGGVTYASGVYGGSSNYGGGCGGGVPDGGGGGFGGTYGGGGGGGFGGTYGGGGGGGGDGGGFGGGGAGGFGGGDGGGGGGGFGGGFGGF